MKGQQILASSFCDFCHQEGNLPGSVLLEATWPRSMPTMNLPVPCLQYSFSLEKVDATSINWLDRNDTLWKSKVKTLGPTSIKKPFWSKIGALGSV